jgi:hypothetical protein
MHFVNGGRCLPMAPDIPPQDCPNGWTATDAGGCVPDRPPSECPAGEFPVLAQGCARVSSCDPYSDNQIREIFATDATIWRVEPGELSAKILEAAPGDLLALAAGEYVGQFDVSGLALVGVCAAQTLIRSEAPSTEVGALNATIGLAEIHDLAVSGNAIGVWIAGGAEVELRNVEVRAARRIGIRVAGGASANLASVWVHDMLPSFEDDSFGRGIQVSADSSATLEDVTIQRVRDIGLVAIGAGASIEFTNVAIASVTENEDPSAPGVGVQAFSGAASVTGTLLGIWDTQSGALVSSGGRVDVEDVYIEGLAVPDTFATEVRGALRSIGVATLDVRGATVEAVEGPALQVDAHGEATISGLRVSNITGPLVSAEELGTAVLSQVVSAVPTLLLAANGADITFENSELRAISETAALEVSNASSVALRQCSVLAAGPAAVVTGSTFDTEDVMFEANDGVTLSGQGTWVRTALVVVGSGLDVLGTFYGTDLELTVGEDPAISISGGRSGPSELGSSYVGGTIELRDGEFEVHDSVLDSPEVAAEVRGGELRLQRVVVVGSARAIVSGGALVDGAESLVVE